MYAALHSMGKPTGKEAIANPKPAVLSNALQRFALPCGALHVGALLSMGKPTGREPDISPDPLCFPLLSAALRCATVPCAALHYSPTPSFALKLFNSPYVNIASRADPIRAGLSAFEIALIDTDRFR